MKKRFIICIDESTKEQEQDFIEFLRETNLGWWHYISNTWLVTDSYGNYSAAKLRDIVKEYFDNAHCVVFELRELSSDTWAGFGPSSNKRNMFKWIKNNWTRK